MNPATGRKHTLTAIALALIAALFIRAWVQLALRDNGVSDFVASDLSYLVVPIVLCAILLPLWNDEKPFVIAQYSRCDLSLNLVTQALTMGLLLRIAWWAQLIAGASFGWYRTDNPDAVVGPHFALHCEPFPNLLLGLFVSACLIPVIEELIHRGYTMRATRRFGLPASALISATIFMIFHAGGTWPTAFATGILFAVVYWRTRSLWYSTIAHASYNALSQIDWRCTSIQWNPLSADLPIWSAGIFAGSVFLISLLGMVLQLAKLQPGTPERPGFL